MTRETMTRADVYQIVTDRIVDLLDRGTVPWHKPWSGADVDGTPRNLRSGKPYRGINVFLLGCARYSSPYFLTFKQVLELGGCVRKGEKGMPVIFWKRLRVDDRENPGTAKLIPMARYYTVFNVEQCDGLKVPSVAAPARPEGFSPIAEAEAVVSGYENPPTIAHAPGGAFYRPSTDTINMPERESFDSPAHYYATLFHELGHSTGHGSRLAREGITRRNGFGSHLYSKEELVAEMTAAMLCGLTGIDGSGVLDNSAAYIANWLGVLKGDRKLVVLAAANAQRAADRILGTKWDAEGETL
jgi:antirestriction protein ArdC